MRPHPCRCRMRARPRRPRVPRSPARTIVPSGCRTGRRTRRHGWRWPAGVRRRGTSTPTRSTPTALVRATRPSRRDRPERLPSPAGAARSGDTELVAFRIGHHHPPRARLVDTSHGARSGGDELVDLRLPGVVVPARRGCRGGAGSSPSSARERVGTASAARLVGVDDRTDRTGRRDRDIAGAQEVLPRFGTGRRRLVDVAERGRPERDSSRRRRRNRSVIWNGVAIRRTVPPCPSARCTRSSSTAPIRRRSRGSGRR